MHSLKIIFCIIQKEYYSILRNKINLFILLSLPLLQIVLYGYIINKDPKHLATMLYVQDDSVFTKTITSSFKNTEYFNFVGISHDINYMRKLMDQNKIQFIVTIPYDFTKNIIKKKTANLFIENDATDPLISLNALLTIERMGINLIAKDLVGPLYYANSDHRVLETTVINRYNPEGKSTTTILPPLIALIIMVTLIVIGSTSITREYENSTIELLFSLNIKAYELIIGKIIPYIIIAYMQMILCLKASNLIFHCDIIGSYLSVMLVTFPFVLANLAIGVFISCMAQSIFQAQQLASFYFMPSMILGGFLYPIQGMPEWAQHLSQWLPLTNYVAVTRAIIMKGTPLGDFPMEILKLICFFFIFILLAIQSYQYRTDSYLAK